MNVSNTIRFVCTTVLLILIAVPNAIGQKSNGVKPYIEKLNSGRVDEVRQALPQLITRYQDSPDLIYLQARLTKNGMEAAKSYRMILDNYPKSEWAGEALYHLYQYDYASGLYQAASEDMARMKMEYPSSPLLADARDVRTPQSNDASRDNAAATNPLMVADPKSISPAPSLLPSSVAGGVYVLQVGAFSTATNAQKQKSRFQKLGYPVEITSKVLEDKGLYVVWVGGYSSSQGAKNEAEKIRKKYKISPMVVQR